MQLKEVEVVVVGAVKSRLNSGEAIARTRSLEVLSPAIESFHITQAVMLTFERPLEVNRRGEDDQAGGHHVTVASDS